MRLHNFMKKLLLIWTMICIFNNVSAVITPTISKPHHSLIKYIEVYVHRGDRSYAPENVIPGYRTALGLDLKVVTWSVPDHGNSGFNPQLIDKLIKWGVDGIITDDPGRLISMLAARGYRVPPRYIAN